jgi:hypothetical protein
VRTGPTRQASSAHRFRTHALLTLLAVCLQRGSDVKALLTDAQRPSAGSAPRQCSSGCNPHAIQNRIHSRHALLARRVRAARRGVAVRAETADVEGTKLDLGDAETTGGQAQYAGILGGAPFTLAWWAGRAGVARNWWQLSVPTSYLRPLPLTRTFLKRGCYNTSFALPWWPITWRFGVSVCIHSGSRRPFKASSHVLCPCL